MDTFLSFCLYWLFQGTQFGGRFDNLVKQATFKTPSTATVANGAWQLFDITNITPTGYIPISAIGLGTTANPNPTGFMTSFCFYNSEIRIILENVSGGSVTLPADSEFIISFVKRK